ncbi:hypothetical protein RI054_37g141130 [Pseudoscourfieldia marina]
MLFRSAVRREKYTIEQAEAQIFASWAWAVALFLQRTVPQQTGAGGEPPTQLAAGTIRNTLSAVSWAHGIRDMEDPLRHPFIAKARKAIGRMTRGTEAGTTKAAWAVPVHHVALIVAAACSERDRFVAAGDLERALAASRDALRFALAFMACLRKSEANGLTRACIKRLRAGGIELWIPWTKNNQGGDHVELMRVVIPPIKTSTSSARFSSNVVSRV